MSGRILLAERPARVALALALLLASPTTILAQSLVRNPLPRGAVPPDVVLVVWDDVGAGACPPAVAPNLAALAAEGLSFPFAFAMPACSQTRTCLHFGVLGRTFGILSDLGPSDPPQPIPPAGWPTLASVLAGHGYATCLVGKWHAGHAPSRPDGSGWQMAPIERGFQRWIAGTKHNAGFLDWERIDADARGFTEATESRYATLVQLEEAELWWLAQPSPRFLMLCLNEAHGPFDRKPPDELLLGYPWPTAPGAERDRYLAKVRAADTALGRILALPGMDRALFVLVGDNGTPNAVATASQGGKAKGTTYDGGIRVPLVMRWPGVRPGSHAELVHVVDVPAACLALAGLPPVPVWDGRMFPPRRFVLAEIQSLVSGSTDRCARGRRYKLRNLDGSEQLFDLQRDPGERRWLDLTDPAIQGPLATLRALLD